MKFDIVDYMGVYEGGVFVSLAILYDEEYTDAIFYYSDKKVALTIEESLEEKIGSSVEDWEGYEKVVYDILEKVLNYDEAIKTLGDLDPSVYGLFKKEEDKEGKEDKEGNSEGEEDEKE